MEARAFVISLVWMVSTWMIYLSIAILRRYAPYLFAESWLIFSSIFDLPFLGIGVPLNTKSARGTRWLCLLS